MVYLAVSGGLLSGEADQEASRGLSGVTLEELEHVAASLGDGGHFGDDRQVVNDEGDLVLLVAGQGLGMAEESEAGHVCSAVGVVFVHQPGAGPVQPGHRVHAPLVGLANVLLADDELDPVPTLRLVKPLVSVDGNLGTQRFGENENIADNSGVGTGRIKKIIQLLFRTVSGNEKKLTL